MIGQHKRDFTVIPYQDDWVYEFEREAQILQSVLRENALRIEHIGSTSIPGMPAKAIIDIMVAVVSLTKARELIPVLESLGYVYRPVDTVPGRVYFRKGNKPEYRTHHLNLVTLDSKFWNNQLAFRNYLREHDHIASQYVALKRKIAEDYARTQVIDLDAKTAFVTKVLALAMVEKGRSG
jgi:GrpB-like predicted nucleotidyltransferase (UPF0157 family)